MNEIVAKTNRINEMTGFIEAMSIPKLMIRVEALENKATTTDCFKRRDSSTGFVVRMEEHIENLDNVQ